MINNVTLELYAQGQPSKEGFFFDRSIKFIRLQNTEAEEET